MATTLREVGLDEAAKVFDISPAHLCNQNHVDLKRLYHLFLGLQNARKSETMSQNLSQRLDSMAKHGFQLESADVISIPKRNQYEVAFEAIIFQETVGSGHSARVSVGRLKGRDEIVAIKVLKCRVNSSVELESFRREIAILSSLSHPSLLKLRGYTSDPPFCLITDYLSNGSLYQFLRNRPDQLGPTERTIIALDVAAGMAYMHEQKVVHRDLKSLNILLDEQKRARICDFGLSRFLTYEPMSGLVGTAQWMAPEVFLSKPAYDTRVDVYSFGIVLWELLTSRIPFDGYDVAQLPTLVVNEGLRPEIPADTPLELAALMTSCWQDDPSRRPTFQQISQLLCSRRYSFPGTDLSVLPRFNVRHTISTSDPLKQTVSIHERRHVKSHSFDQRRVLSPTDLNLLRLCEALQSDSGDLQCVILSIRTSVKQGTNPSDYLPDLLTAIDDNFGPRTPELMRMLADFLDGRQFFLSFMNANGGDYLCHWLESQSPENVPHLLSILEANRAIELFTVPTIRALLLFYNFGDIHVRGRALAILLAAAESQRHFLCSLPTFVAHLLDFGALPLPDDLWDRLLTTAADLLMGMDTLPEMAVERLAVLPSRVPDQFMVRMLRCLQVALRFPVFRENMPDLIWEFAAHSFDSASRIFDAFMEQPPEHPGKMIRCLIAAVPGSLGLLVHFAGFPSCAREIAAGLPLGREDEFWPLYVALAGQGESRVYNEPDFYDFMARHSQTRISSKVLQLLKSDNVRVDIAQQFNFVGRLCRDFINEKDPGRIWELLSVMYKWCSMEYRQEFEVIIPKLLFLLAGSSQLAAFLLLTLFADHCPEKIDVKTLLELAVVYVVDGSDAVRDICVRLLDRNRPAASRVVGKLAGVFLAKCRQPSQPARNVAALLLAIGAAGGLPEDTEAALASIANA
jgi:serine/threonine protein kinase